MKYFYAKIFGRTKTFKFEKMKDFVDFCKDNFVVIREIGFRNGRTTISCDSNNYEKLLGMLPEKFKN